MDDYWETLLKGLVGSLVFGGTGIILAVLGFKVFDWITPRMDIQRELAEKQNVAVAIVCGAIILGVCFLVATVVH
jgi:putative membrane protein